jgi:hypothetical protein
MVARSTRRPSFRSKLRAVEVLESRELLATFSVTNLQNSGAGSLRQAIIDSNAQPGGNTIDFDVAGTIRISKSSLPAITDPVIIDGSTAPTFAGSPVVTVDFQATKRLNFAAGSDGSTLKSHFRWLKRAVRELRSMRRASQFKATTSAFRPMEKTSLETAATAYRSMRPHMVT